FGFTLDGVNSSILRRCWVRWDASTSAYNDLVYLDGSSDNLIENCVLTSSPNAQEILGFEVDGTVDASNNNRFVGDIAVGAALSNGYVVSSDKVNLAGNQVSNSVAIGSAAEAVFQRSDSDLRLDHLTLAEVGVGVGLSPNPTEPVGFVMNVDVRDSVIY